MCQGRRRFLPALESPARFWRGESLTRMTKLEEKSKGKLGSNLTPSGCFIGCCLGTIRLDGILRMNLHQNHCCAAALHSTTGLFQGSFGLQVDTGLQSPGLRPKVQLLRFLYAWFLLIPGTLMPRVCESRHYLWNDPLGVFDRLLSTLSRMSPGGGPRQDRNVTFNG